MTQSQTIGHAASGPLSRFIAFLYGIAAYLVFFITFLYAV